MKKIFFKEASRGFLFLVPVVAICLAGCARDERPIYTLEERQQASSPEPPPILSAPVVALFTNQPGFGAHCTVDQGTTRKALEGEFLHRADQFLFATQAHDKQGRGREMTFIWDAVRNEGRALNDALPAYAPLASRPSITSVESTGKAPASEKINGHASTQEKLLMQLSDGSQWQLTVWRADDLRGFPVRIRSELGANRWTVDLTDVRLQEPAARLFETPADFVRYDTPKAMFDEMFRRESLTRRETKQRATIDEEEWQRTGKVRPNL